MEQTLKQRIIPEIDERETKRESEKVAEFLDESVKDFLPFSEGDGIFDMDDMMEDMEEMQDMTDEMVGGGMFESFSADGFAGDVAFGEGPAEMGGMDDGTEELTTGIDELVDTLSEPGQQDGMADKLNEVGTKIDENKEQAAVSTGLLAKLGKMFKMGAGTLLIGGFALSLLQGIYGRVKKFAQHSPLLETVVDMIGMAMSLFLRPIARMIGKALLPMAIAMLNLATGFNRVWNEGGMWAAMGFLAGQLLDALFSIPGMIAFAITGIGAYLGFVIGSAVGAKAGAIIGGTIGTAILPGLGTALGVAIGGTLGLIAGLLVGFNFDKVTNFLGKIWRKMTDVENILSFFLGPLALFAVPFFVWFEGLFSSVADWVESIYKAFKEKGITGAIKKILGLEDIDLKKIFDEMFDSIVVQPLKNKISEARDAFDNAVDWVKKKGRALRDKLAQVGTWIRNAGQDVRNYLANGANKIRRRLNGFENTIRTKANDFANMLLQAKNNLRNKLNNIPNAILKKIKNLTISATEFVNSIPWKFPSANKILKKLNIPDISGTFNRAEGFVSDLGSEVEDTIDWFKDLTSLDVSMPGRDNDDNDDDDDSNDNQDDDDRFDFDSGFDPDYGDAPTTNTADYGGGGDSSTIMGGTSDEQADPDTWIGLASGGIVTDTISTVIGEGNESEVVAPLSKLDSMINSRANARNVNISVEGATGSGMSERQLARAIEQGVQNANADVDDSQIQAQLQRVVSEINKMRSDLDLSVKFNDKSKWEVKK